jgi:hypothetical protein
VIGFEIGRREANLRVTTGLWRPPYGIGAISDSVGKGRTRELINDRPPVAALVIVTCTLKIGAPAFLPLGEKVNSRSRRQDAMRCRA